MGELLRRFHEVTEDATDSPFLSVHPPIILESNLSPSAENSDNIIFHSQHNNSHVYDSDNFNAYI
jgi:hypothetical protein